MDSLQYFTQMQWIALWFQVLNLVINGQPSILRVEVANNNNFQGFKPCYKWIAFNTVVDYCDYFDDEEF